MATTSSLSSLSSSSIRFTVTDGADIVAGGYPLPRTWGTQEEAAEAMRDMCWSPRRFAGPFRVEPVRVESSKWGTTLSVERVTL